LKWMGSLFGLSKENQFEFWSSSFLVTYLYKVKCIYDIVCIVIYNQSVTIIHFEGWKRNQLHHSYKGDRKSSKIQM
jgi:hypothetical protein